MNTTMFQVAWAACRLMYPDVDVSPLIPMAQAVNESANFTSHVYEVNNNLFGMRAPQARETTCTNKGQDAFAHYSNPLDSIRDFFLFLRAFNLKSDGDLDAHLKAGKYAPGNRQYYSRIMAGIAALKKQNKYIEPAVIYGAGVVSAAAGGYVMVKAISHIVDGL